MGKEEEEAKLQAASVTHLDGTVVDYKLHRGSDGEVLFTLVTSSLSIEEKDYFSLCFFDKEGIRHWLYNDKKIIRQLKGLPWQFSFQVKFYPTAPTTLTDDNARHNLFLQLRNDIQSGRLGASLPIRVQLASYVAQAEFGDAVASAEYEQYLRAANLTEEQKPEVVEKVRELHVQHKGMTDQDAETKYLEICKDLSTYGLFMFPAKDAKDVPVVVGICAHGINIYREQIRVHRFSWQNIIKISYRRHYFAIKVKSGEVDKKETTLTITLPTYEAAKRVWKCGVEHHTFFRLIQPDKKTKGGIFRFGTQPFRFQGRTQFQTKMASQMFDQPSNVVRSPQSARHVRSLENVDEITVQRHSSVGAHHENGMSSPELLRSPEKSYVISVETEKRRHHPEQGAENREGKGKSKKQKKEATDSSTSSDSSDDVRHEVVVHTRQQKKQSPSKVVRQETKAASYKLSGEGLLPPFQPNDASLMTTLTRCEQLNARSPVVAHSERVCSVRAHGLLPSAFTESGEPHMTVASWNESTELPEEVVVEKDEHGNVITRTIKTKQVKHTVQKFTTQGFNIDPAHEHAVSSMEREHSETVPVHLPPVHGGGVVQTHTRTVEYQADHENANQENDVGEFVSSKTVTSGNRTVETITYKVEKNGVVETHVEHRVTIHSDGDIDHDAELSAAILEATNMNPDMTVEKIEVRQESSS